MRPALAPAVVIAVVLAAGCSGFATGPTTDDSRRTPYEVPDRQTSSESPDATPTPENPAGSNGSADRGSGASTGGPAANEGSGRTTGGPGGNEGSGGTADGTGSGEDPGKAGDETEPTGGAGGTTDRDPIRVDADEVAPGVTEQLVASPARLASAHRGVLANRSYRVGVVRTVRYSNGTRRTVRVEARVGASGRAVVARRVVAPPGNRTVGVVAVQDGARRRVEGSMAPSVVLPAELDYRGLVEGALRATNVVEVRAVPGSIAPAVYRVRSVATAPDRFAGHGAAPDARVSNLSVRAVVDSRGLVRNLTLRYALVRDGSRVAVRTRVRFSGVGTTAVAVPANATATGRHRPVDGAIAVGPERAGN